MAKGRQRRRWSLEEKQRICAQARLPGISVSQVARRYGVNANQVFNWLKDPRFVGVGADGETTFQPVEVIEAAPAARSVSSAAPASRIEIELAGGHRLRVQGGFAPEALAELIRKLSA